MALSIEVSSPHELMNLANKAEGAEVEYSATSVPRSVILAMIIKTDILAFGWIILSIGNVNAALESPTGYPIIEIFYQATGTRNRFCEWHDMCYHHRCLFFASAIHVPSSVGVIMNCNSLISLPM